MILKKWKKTKTKKDQQIKEILQNPGMGVAGSDNVKIFGWFDIVYRGQPKVTMELQKWPLFPHKMENLLHSHIAGLHVLNQTLECDHWTEGPFALSARPVNILQEVAQWDLLVPLDVRMMFLWNHSLLRESMNQRNSVNFWILFGSETIGTKIIISY